MGLHCSIVHSRDRFWFNQYKHLQRYTMAYSWDNRVKFVVRYMYDIDGNGSLDKNDFECLAVRNTVIEGKGDWNEATFKRTRRSWLTCGTKLLSWLTSIRTVRLTQKNSLPLSKKLVPTNPSLICLLLSKPSLISISDLLM